MDELLEKLLPFIKEHVIALIFGIVGISCLGFGLLSFVQLQPSQDDNFQQKQADSFETKPQISPITKQITIGRGSSAKTRRI